MTTFVGIQTEEKVVERTIVLQGTAILLPGTTSISIPIPTNFQAASGRELDTDWEIKLDEESGVGSFPPVPNPVPHAPTHSDGGTDEVTVEDLATGSADASAALRPDGAGGLAFSDVDHADLTGVGIDDHHAEDHAVRHDENGPDEILVEGLGTAELDSDLVLKPDGAGGLAFAAGGGGSGVATTTFLISEPGPAEVDTPGFFTDAGFTVGQLNAVLTGPTSPSVTWTLRFGPDRTPGGGTEVITGGTTTTSVTTGDEITSFTNDVIPAGSWVWIETTAQSGTVGTIAVTVTPA